MEMSHAVMRLIAVHVTIWSMILPVGEAAGPATLRAPSLAPDQRAQVLTLASPHLGQQIPAGAQWDRLSEVLDALARYEPDLIAVESLSGEMVERYERSSPTYDQVLQTFAADAIAAGKAARAFPKLEDFAASDRADALVLSFAGKAPDSISAADRKQAALMLAAAYELPSAALQWSYLPAEQRVADAEMPAKVAEALNRLLSSRNEAAAVGIVLAVRMNLQRVHGVDDQSDALFQLRSGGQLMQELGQSPELKKLQDSRFFKELPDRLGKHATEGDFIGLYRWMNAPGYAALDLDAQWHLFHRARLPSGLDRRRAGLWEVRNLRIAANIREALAETGAKRALVIIGASHKAFLDVYLTSMMDLVVVDAESVLGR